MTLRSQSNFYRTFLIGEINSVTLKYRGAGKPFKTLRKSFLITSLNMVGSFVIPKSKKNQNMKITIEQHFKMN